MMTRNSERSPSASPMSFVMSLSGAGDESPERDTSSIGLSCGPEMAVHCWIRRDMSRTRLDNLGSHSKMWRKVDGSFMFMTVSLCCRPRLSLVLGTSMLPSKLLEFTVCAADGALDGGGERTHVRSSRS